MSLVSLDRFEILFVRQLIFFFHTIEMFILQEALKKRLNARIEYAKFLQETVKEMAKEVQSSRSGEVKKTAEDLDEFMSKVSSQQIII